MRRAARGEPRELTVGIGFNSDEATCVFADTSTEQITQIVDAVPVAKLRASARALMADAAPLTRAPSGFREAAQ
ncbi:hypothetical protein NVS89_15585 [Ancylobacter sp. MQZ15Z-1]|uniref:Uncharacterized protein n=1 Tax=Ancylobacter mangrovi TaxID=2972472 RepID=A0A9X2T6L9_9HYPH|nr:hypothetical protein [Ancylobacter mangrovi]MCS0496524.1 hypothetical protein [Ancylobacter mangrovi]